MPLQHIHVTHRYTLPVERVFSFLAEHENLTLLFRAPVTRVRSGEAHRNGVGSTRRIGPAKPLGFEERVVAFVPDELIEYRISSPTLLRHHLGTLRFSEDPAGGTVLTYDIHFGSAVPGVAPALRRVLGRTIARGLAMVETRA